MKFKLITPLGMLFTTALLVVYAIYAFMIGSIEDAWPLLAAGLVATAAACGTAMVRPWSRHLVYMITIGFAAKLGLSIWQAKKAGYFEFQFGSIAAAVRSILPEATMAVLGFFCCVLVWRQFLPATNQISHDGTESPGQ